MLPELDVLPALGEPMEILEMQDGEIVEFTVERHELGKALIHPRDGREAKVIRVLRVYVPQADKPTLPYWWDITSQGTIAGMLPHLERRGARRPRLRLTKRGSGPRGRHTMEVLPAG